MYECGWRRTLSETRTVCTTFPVAYLGGTDVRKAHLCPSSALALKYEYLQLVNCSVQCRGTL